MSLPDGSDADLVSLSLSGNSAAFTALMQRHKGWLYRFICRYVRETADAQDIVQDSFIAAWNALSSYDTSRPLSHWLRRIALNKCRDRARKQAVRRFLLPWSAAAVEETAADPAMAADERMVQDEFRLQVQRAVAMLPEPAKSALILTEIEGLSHAAAAEILGTTPKAVEGRVARAKKKLSASLVSHVHEDGQVE